MRSCRPERGLGSTARLSARSAMPAKIEVRHRLGEIAFPAGIALGLDAIEPAVLDQGGGIEQPFATVSMPPTWP